MKNVLENDTNNTQKRWVVEMMEHKDITPASSKVGMTIYLMWWNEDSDIFPSNKSMMRATALSANSITRGVKELVNEGFITTTGNKSTQGESYHYHPQSGKQAVKDAADAIAADYLNLNNEGYDTYTLDFTTSNLESTTSFLESTTSNLEHHYLQDGGVSNKEVRKVNSKEVIEGGEEVKETGVSSLDDKTARAEHKVKTIAEKQHEAQAIINAEFSGVMK